MSQTTNERAAQRAARGTANDRVFTLQEVTTSEDSPVRGLLGEKSLRDLIRADRMPGTVRVGKRVFITLAGLREFIAAGGAR